MFASNWYFNNGENRLHIVVTNAKSLQTSNIQSLEQNKK